MCIISFSFWFYYFSFINFIILDHNVIDFFFLKKESEQL